MSVAQTHRLEGLEPDNLLAFLALLGLLRALENSRPDWMPRARWTVDEPPVRPTIQLRSAVTQDEIATAAVEGIGALASAHSFAPKKKLEFPSDEARTRLKEAAADGGYAAVLWSALVSDKAQKPGDAAVEATPLCLLKGNSQQYFLSRLRSVPRTPAPTPRGRGESRRVVSEIECIQNALFRPWQRRDLARESSFRWDPVEDRRYAYRAINPTDAKDPPTTEHGANCLASVGLASLTVVPRRRGLNVRLAARGSGRGPGRFALLWPIWRHPVSRATIEAMLSHPNLEDSTVRASLGVLELRQTTRISSSGWNMNFTRATRVEVKSDRTTGRRSRI